ncbi:hypothetical protein RBSH_03451 [Rhodopirellula baltica SH28]|uniref:Uncharacterized protein n=1 Tax=Rhodopirellula baltica SH28 TaxID=993517 RepID=K5D3L5_RHOBT|nr:hypothetical protein RBSH_03451 [Rhodopirellula baltica SH28]
MNELTSVSNDNVRWGSKPVDQTSRTMGFRAFLYPTSRNTKD